MPSFHFHFYGRSRSRSRSPPPANRLIENPPTVWIGSPPGQWDSEGPRQSQRYCSSFIGKQPASLSSQAPVTNPEITVQSGTWYPSFTASLHREPQSSQVAGLQYSQGLQSRVPDHLPGSQPTLPQPSWNVPPTLPQQPQELQPSWPPQSLTKFSNGDANCNVGAEAYDSPEHKVDVHSLKHIQDVQHEWQQACSTHIEQEWPQLGTLAGKTVYVQWPRLELERVRNYKGRKEWVQEVMSQTIPASVCNSVRDALYEIMYRDGTVHSMPEQVLDLFTKAVAASGQDVRQIVHSGKSFCIEGRSIWFLRTMNFPSATFNFPDSPQLNWLHCTNKHGVYGILRAGAIFPSCADGIMLPMCIRGFFLCINIGASRIAKRNDVGFHCVEFFSQSALTCVRVAEFVQSCS